MKAEFKQAQSNLNQCLYNELVSLINVAPEPEMAIKVASTRCQHIALSEAQRLKQLNANNGHADEFAELMLGIPSSSNIYTEAFTKEMTKKENIEDQARNILMIIIEEVSQ